MSAPGPLDTALDIPTAPAIEQRLRAELEPTVLEVIDDSAAHAGHSGSNGLGYGTHFKVRIGGPRLQGLTRVAAHRLVYDALRPFFDAGLHAVAIDVVR